MRDLLVTLIIFAALPLIFYRAWFGIIMWSWIGYMNPHRLTWGFAYNFPFAQFVGAATLIGLLFTRDRKKIPMSALTVVWITFIVWMNVSTLFALSWDVSMEQWDKVMKIMLMAIVTIFLMQSRERVTALIWTIVLSLGFFGVKGGIFALGVGGEYRVYGPKGSFFQDNNALALALIMALPLMRYLQMYTSRKYIYWGMFGMMALTGLAVLGSHSRGGFLAGGCMAIFLWLKSRNKLVMGIALLILAPFGFMFMPEEWHERMDTIVNGHWDGSILGRINAWHFAFNLALHRPLTGGGFDTFTRELFLVYAPNGEDYHDAHSIYFEVLAEHGFVGLFLFLTMGVLAFRTGSWLIRRTRKREDIRWAHDLGAMLQVSIVGYAVAGAFQGLAYFDFYYHIIGILIITRALVQRELDADPAEATAPSLYAPAQRAPPPAKAVAVTRIQPG